MQKEKLKALKEKYADKMIDGNLLSKEIKNLLAEKTIELQNSKGIQPGLAVVLVGDDPASAVYVRNKETACQKIGFYSEVHRLSAEISEKELLDLIDSLNNNDKIHGILVQLPLPSHIEEKKVINSINPDKDVDGFHPISVGNMVIGQTSFLPCTPAGIMAMLKRYHIETSSKNVVVLGRSLIVGKPMANLLIEKGIDATVTVCHSRTADIKAHTSRADILIAAIGKAKFVNSDMVKDGAILIDVGMNRDEDGTLCGDVDFEDVLPKVSKITPVPGGVGPMTIAMLMVNTFKSSSGEWVI